MAAFSDNMRTVFGFAIIPAIIAVTVLVLGVKEPVAGTRPRLAKPPIRWSDLGSIGTSFWIAVAVGMLFTMARFSEAFLVLRGANAGIPLTLLPFVMIVMNLVYAIASAPVGSLSDTVGRKPLLASGIAVLLIADLVLAYARNPAGVLIGVALWGLHLGLTQGLLAALVADTAPVHRRGTAFGLFNLATGITMLGASLLAGALWSARGASLTFLTGGGFAVIALIGVLALLKEEPVVAETAA